MAEFINPFSGVVPDRKLTARELTRAIRLSMSAEEEAIHLYEALADATDDPLAREVLQDIADEERVHAGEFQRLLKYLLPDEQALLDEGAQEVQEMAENLGGGPAGDADAETPSDPAESPSSVGSLKDKPDR